MSFVLNLFLQTTLLYKLYALGSKKFIYFSKFDFIIYSKE